MLLECSIHWFKEEVACQDAAIGIVTGDHYTFRIEDIDKIGERHAQKYPCVLKGCLCGFIAVFRLFYYLMGSGFLDSHLEIVGG